MVSGAEPGPGRVVGRYALYGEIASGGMATVHYGRLLGPVGFSRTVAIKRLHPQYARDPEFVSMFLDEARLAARIRHPNAVPTLDVVALGGELFLVMDYVQGEPLSRLLRLQRASGRPIPLGIVGAIMSGALHGLHAAHDAKSEHGAPLGIVHRDVSPQNVMVGIDGVARVLDFGVAKAAGRVQTTREGQIKGKLPYMAPEQIRGDPVDRRVDVYAASVVLWEMLAGRALFRGDNDGMLFGKVIEGAKEPPSAHQPGLPRAIDDVVMRGLRLDPAERFASAREMAIALEDAAGVAPPRHVGEWIEALAGASIAERAERIKEIESMSSSASIVGDSAEVKLVEAKPPRASVARRPADKPEMQSQVSSVSLAGNTPASSASPIRGRYVVAALVLLLAGATLFWLGRAAAPTAASDASASSPSAPPPAPSAAVVVVAAAPVASAPSSVAPPSPSASTAATSAPERTAAPARKTPTAPRKAPKNCNPPFIVDSGGIKRPKPECL